MSSIDKRIVEMQFDNSQFEKGISTSMKSLDGLKKKLNFDSDSAGMSSLICAADLVSKRLSTMGIAGVTAIQNITNSVVNASKRMISSLTTDQLSAGMTKYEQKIASVQTIMNSTGKTIMEVNDYLEQLMWFSDETSYGFTDMTAALAQMSASGGDVEKLIPLITGVANATAFAGKGAGEFSRAMYNLNQSYGMGYLQSIDWKSLELAGVGSKQLKQMMIDTGVSMGKIKEGEVTVSNFQDTLSNKWASREVMEEAFGKFSEFSDAVRKSVESGEYDTASEAIEAMAEKYDELGVKAFKSAQTAKTFTEAVGATKDAVSSGWMKTYEILFGNITEATELFTKLTDILWTAFASGAEKRNEVLQSWKGFGGRLDLLNGLGSIYNAVFSMSQAIGEAFRNIFPPITAETLVNITKSLKNFGDNLLHWLFDVNDGTNRFRQIRSVFEGIFSVFKIGIGIFKAVGSALWTFLGPLLSSAFDGVLGFFAGLGDSITKFAKGFRSNETVVKIMGYLSSALSVLGDVIRVSWGAISKFFVNNFPKWLSIAQKYLAPFVEKFNGFVQTVRTAIRGLFGERGKDDTKTIFQILKEMLATPEGINELKTNVITFVTKFWEDLKTSIKTILGKGGKLEAIGNFILPVIAKIKEFGVKIKEAFRSLLDPENLKSKTGIWTLLKETFATPEGAKAFINRVVQMVKDTWKTIKEKIIGIFTGTGSDEVAKSYKDLIGIGYRTASAGMSDVNYTSGEKDKPGGLLGGIFTFLEAVWGWLKGNWGWLAGGAFLIGLFAVLFKTLKVAKIFATVGTILAQNETPLKRDFSKTFLKIAGSIAIIAGSIIAISKIDKDRLGSSIAVVAGILTVLTLITVLGSRKKIQLSLPKFNSIGTQMAGISAAILMMVIALDKASDIIGAGSIEDWKRIMPGLILITALLATMTVFANGLGKMDGNGSKHGWKNIIAVAIGAWILIKALKPLMNLEHAQLLNMGYALGGLTIAIGALIAVSRIGSGSGKITGIIKLAIGIWLLVKTLKPFADMDKDQFIKMGVALGGIVAAISIFMLASKGLDAKSVVGSILALGAMAGVIYVLGNALQSIKNMSWQQIGAFTGGITKMVLAMSVQTFVSGLSWFSGINSLLASGGLAGVIFMLGDAMSKIPEDINPDVIATFTAGLALLVGANGVSALLNGFSPLSGVNNFLSSLGLSAVIPILGDTLSNIPEDIDTDVIATFTAGLALLVGANGVSALLNGFLPLSGANNILSSLALSAVIPILGDALSKIPEDINPDIIATFTAGLSLLVGANGVSALLNGFLPLSGANNILSSLALSAVIPILGDTLSKIPNDIDTDVIAAFTAGLSLLVGANGVSALLNGFSPLSGVNSILSSLALSAVIPVLGDTLSKIPDDIDTDAIAAFTAGLSLLIGANGVSALLNGFSPLSGVNSILSSFALSAIIPVLGDTLSKIPDDIDTDAIAAFTAGLALLVGANGVSALLNGFSPLSGVNNVLSSLALSAVIPVLGDTLSKIPNDIDTDVIAAFTAGLSLLVGANGVSALLNGFSPLSGVNNVLSSIELLAVIPILGAALEKIPDDIRIDVITAFTTGLSLLVGANGVSALLNGISPLSGVNNVLSSLGLASAMSTLGDALTKIPDVKESVITAFTTGLANLIGDENTNGLKTFFEAISPLSGINDALTNLGLSTLVENVGTALSDMANSKASEETVTVFWDALTKLKEFSEALPDMNLGELLTKAVLGDEVTSFSASITSLGNSMNTVFGAFNLIDTDNFETKVTSGMGLLTKLKDFLIVANTDDALATGGLYNPMAVSSQLLMDLTVLGEDLNTFNENIEGIQPLKFGIIVNAVTGYATALSGLLKVVDGDEGVFDPLITSLGELSAVLSTDIIGELSDKIQNETSITDMEDAFNEVLLAGLLTILDSIDSFCDYGNILTASLSDGVQDEISTIKINDAFEAVLVEGLSAIKDRFTSFYSYGAGLVTKVSAGIVANSLSKMNSAAYNLVQGFATGIYKYTYLATSAAYSLGASAIDALNEGTDSHSPSEEGIAGGHNVADGFQIGIDDRKAEILDNLYEFGKASVTALNDGVNVESENGLLGSSGIVSKFKTIFDNTKTNIEDLIPNDFSNPINDFARMSGLDGWLDLFGLSEIIDGNAATTADDTADVVKKKTPTAATNLSYMQTVGLAPTQNAQNDILVDKLDNLARAITTMKIVMDSGVLVGQIGPKMDQHLGIASLYAGRQ